MTLDVQEQTRRVREYWNSRIHDLEMTDKPPGSMAFFQELDAHTARVRAAMRLRHAIGAPLVR